MSTERMMQRSAVDTAAAVNYPGIAVAVGGLLGLSGVFLDWFSYSYAVPGGRIVTDLVGYDDWTGQVAFIAGIAAFAFALANMILADPQIRRLTAALMGVSAVLVLGACIGGFFRLDVVTADPVLLGVEPGQQVTVSSAVAGGLLVSTVGGIFAVAGAMLLLRPDGVTD
jgi:hypothetical protein